LRKTPIFSQKSAKIAENCDHNIDPRSHWLYVLLSFFRLCLKSSVGHFFSIFYSEIILLSVLLDQRVKQGDQIGRIFAFRAIVYIQCHVFEITYVVAFMRSFYHGKSFVYVLILTKNVLGYILGDFFSQTHLVTVE
jgi:uncharacterized MAPEG superfamily protein